ncbi:MAG: putative zinc-binding metallopeptidase [Coriobacteriia bacterium]|nr:putative zinc-binding metallopeptidase [Coriobacteriia bacterium]
MSNMRKLRGALSLVLIALAFMFVVTGCDFLDDEDYGYSAEVNDRFEQEATHSFESLSEIEDYYDIEIHLEDPVWHTSQVVEIFNQQADTLGPTLLRELVAFYRDEGYPTIFIFETPSEEEEASVEIHDEAVEFVVSHVEGAHAALIHEMGHLVHFYLLDIDQDPEAEFVALNEGFSYVGAAWEDFDVLPAGYDRVFVTTYAMSEPAEDFAETFGFAYRYPDHRYDGEPYEEGVIAASYDSTSPVARKVAFVRAIVPF